MKFKTQYNAVPDTPQSFEGAVSKTEKAGYLPAKKIIEQMIMAGMRLKSFREDNYDLGPEDEDDGEYIDVTRTPGFDLADASQISMDLNRRNKEAEKALKKAGNNPPKADKMQPEAPQKEEPAP